MKNSLRGFVLVAVGGLAVLVLTQTTVHAQYRRHLPARPVPVRPVYPVYPVYPTTPRVPVAVPSVQSYTNPYVLPGMTLNQLATLNALSMDPTYLMNLRLYNNAMRPIGVTPMYPGYPYGGTVPYNPYFAAYGLYP